MKKVLLALILLTSIAHAQPYISLGFTTKGAALGVGYMENNFGFDFSFVHNISYRKTYIPTITSFSVGRCTLLTTNDENNLSLTPSIGIAHSTKKDFSEYNIAPAYKIITVNKTLPFFGLELGKDIGISRISLTANYCGMFYAGVGIKAFFK
ncbi:MAG: hypothetical protein V4594_16780 [Bacteroidota bacterium]